MQLPHIVALALIIAQASAATNFTAKNHLNGWYPCFDYTFSDAGSSSGQHAECAVYTAPLCYDGICETPDSVYPNVDIFFKRSSATTGDLKTATNVWLLQGGPGSSSTKMEIDMLNLHHHFQGAVNVYTMDHRGIGRSTHLDCVAAQVSTTGSPWGSAIKNSEIPACAKDLHTKYGDLTSFSVTSAATDLATFITKFTNGASTIVYGLSYGTVLVERLIHLASPEVTGYVVDGVWSASGAADNDFMFLSNWDTNFGEVGDAFLAFV